MYLHRSLSEPSGYYYLQHRSGPIPKSPKAKIGGAHSTNRLGFAREERGANANARFGHGQRPGIPHGGRPNEQLAPGFQRLPSRAYVRWVAETGSERSMPKHTTRQSNDAAAMSRRSFGLGWGITCLAY